MTSPTRDKGDTLLMARQIVYHEGCSPPGIMNRLCKIAPASPDFFTVTSTKPERRRANSLKFWLILFSKHFGSSLLIYIAGLLFGLITLIMESTAPGTPNSPLFYHPTSIVKMIPTTILQITKNNV